MLVVGGGGGLSQGDGHRDGDPGQRGVDAGLQHAEPDEDADQYIGPEAVDPRPIAEREAGETCDGQGEGQEAQLSAVEEGDDEDGDQIVDDRHRRQEYLERSGHARAEEGQHTEGKGDVCGGRDRPAAKAGSVSPVDGDIDEGGHDHACGCCQAGKQAVRPSGELPVQHLPFDFEAHDQEEQRHEAVVDPVEQAEPRKVDVERVEIGG